MEIALTSDGNVLVIERTGAVKLAEIKSWKVKTIAALEVAQRKKEHARECGLLGISLDPKFTQNNWIYPHYSLKKNPSIASPGSLSQTTNSPMKKFSREASVCGANNKCHHPQHNIGDTLQMLEASLQFPVK